MDRADLIHDSNGFRWLLLCKKVSLPCDWIALTLYLNTRKKCLNVSRVRAYTAASRADTIIRVLKPYLYAPSGVRLKSAKVAKKNIHTR